MSTEGSSELDWCKRVFDGRISELHQLAEVPPEGHYVIPPPPENLRDPVSFRAFAEGRPEDVPEPHPLPGVYSGEFGRGLETQSGKIEFVSNSIQRGDPDNPERPALNRYIPSWEGLRNQDLAAK